MLRGVNPLLRSSARSLSVLRAPATRPVITVRLTSSTALLSRPRVSRPRLLPAIWSAELSTKPPEQPTKIDKKYESEVAQKKIEPDPDRVSSKSTVRPFFEPTDENSQSAKREEPDVLHGVKADISTVAEDFALKAVPRKTLVLGLAGTLPYLATSLSTMYFSWDLNTTLPTSSSIFNSLSVSHDTAAQWLQLLEPIQLGYGAIIISFLGAVHWGLEFAERTPSSPRTNFRYGIGVLAPAMAWPTLFLPVEWALLGQFAAFVALYFADARAATRGWAPPWYATYRFVLTLVVGVALFVSLVGRAKIGQNKESSAARLQERSTKGAEPYEAWAKIEQEEKVKEAIRKKKEAERKRKEEEEGNKKQKTEGGDKKGVEKKQDAAKDEAKDSGDKSSE